MLWVTLRCCPLLATYFCYSGLMFCLGRRWTIRKSLSTQYDNLDFKVDFSLVNWWKRVWSTGGLWDGSIFLIGSGRKSKNGQNLVIFLEKVEKTPKNRVLPIFPNPESDTFWVCGAHRGTVTDLQNHFSAWHVLDHFLRKTRFFGVFSEKCWKNGENFWKKLKNRQVHENFQKKVRFWTEKSEKIVIFGPVDRKLSLREVSKSRVFSLGNWWKKSKIRKSSLRGYLNLAVFRGF